MFIYKKKATRIESTKLKLALPLKGTLRIRCFRIYILNFQRDTFTNMEVWSAATVDVELLFCTEKRRMQQSQDLREHGCTVASFFLCAKIPFQYCENRRQTFSLKHIRPTWRDVFLLISAWHGQKMSINELTAYHCSIYYCYHCAWRDVDKLESGRSFKLTSEGCQLAVTRSGIGRHACAIHSSQTPERNYENSRVCTPDDKMGTCQDQNKIFTFPNQ